MRSHWDVAAYLESGRLRPVLPGWALPAADVTLVYPTKSDLSAKTRALADFLGEWFAGRRVG
jgi:LysR family transcriptional regulator, transcriptional activator for dmlA